MTIKTVGVHELKTHLSRYLQEVQQGATILISEHQRPVAQLGPPLVAADAATLRQRLRSLNRAGLLIWQGEDAGLEPIEPARKLRDDVLVSDLVVEDRD